MHHWSQFVGAIWLSGESEGTLMIGDEQVPLRKPRDGDDATFCHVTLGDCVELPAQSETARILNHPGDMKRGV